MPLVGRFTVHGQSILNQLCRSQLGREPQAFNALCAVAFLSEARASSRRRAEAR